MEFVDFLPSSIVTIFVLAIVYFGRNFIKAWIDSRVRLTSEKDLERFRNELDAEKAHLAAIRDSVLSGRTSRQAIVDERRFEAIDALWLSVREFDRFSAAPRFLESVKLDVVFDEIESDKRLAQFFELLHKSIGGDVTQIKTVTFQDHYVPAKVLSLYILYVQMITVAAMIIQLGKMGRDARKWIKSSSMNEDVKSLLPYFANFLEQNGEYAWIFLPNVVREALKAELAGFVNDTQADYEVLERRALERKVLPETVNEQALSALQKLPAEMKRDARI